MIYDCKCLNIPLKTGTIYKTIARAVLCCVLTIFQLCASLFINITSFTLLTLRENPHFLDKETEVTKVNCLVQEHRASNRRPSDESLGLAAWTSALGWSETGPLCDPY